MSDTVEVEEWWDTKPFKPRAMYWSKKIEGGHAYGHINFEDPSQNYSYKVTLDRSKYRGTGRPRKEDYLVTVI